MQPNAHCTFHLQMQVASQVVPHCLIDVRTKEQVAGQPLPGWLSTAARIPGMYAR
jgi:hypothetical protein